MHSALICPNETLYTDFGQWKWNILYVSTVISLIRSMVYKLLVNFDTYMFWRQGCIRLDQKHLNGIQGVK